MPVRKRRTFEDYYPGFSGSDQSFEIKTESHNLGAISASGNYFLMVAPSDCKIVKVKLLVDTAIAVDTSNYWQAQLANLTQIDDLLSTSDDLNYDTAISADTPVTLTPDQNTYLRDGDVLELQLTKNASADNLSGLYVVVEYVVTGKEATTTSTTTTTTTTSSSTTTTTTSSSTSTS